MDVVLRCLTVKGVMKVLDGAVRFYIEICSEGGGCSSEMFDSKRCWEWDGCTSEMFWANLVS